MSYLFFAAWLLLILAFWWTYAPQKTIAQILRELDAPLPRPTPPLLAVGPRLPDATTVTRPEKCPECGSKAVGTLAKEITAATYWRCHQCGNVWNQGRDRAGPRPQSWRW